MLMSRASLIALASIGVLTAAQGCAPPGEAAAPQQEHAAKSDREIAREQRALERRRLKLEHQVLAELSKLRERRQASTEGAEPSADEEPTTADCPLLVFGGATHEVFLGCLADEKRPDSVFNLVGEHGSDLSPTSIRNKFAPYGSNYDDTSACNAAAKHPPVVVTSGGKSLGLLSNNTSLKRRITSPSVNDWLARMCSI
jgi:hypothetical protein